MNSRMISANTKSTRVDCFVSVPFLELLTIYVRRALTSSWRPANFTKYQFDQKADLGPFVCMARGMEDKDHNNITKTTKMNDTKW